MIIAIAEHVALGCEVRHIPCPCLRTLEQTSYAAYVNAAWARHSCVGLLPSGWTWDKNMACLHLTLASNSCGHKVTAAVHLNIIHTLEHYCVEELYRPLDPSFPLNMAPGFSFMQPFILNVRLSHVRPHLLSGSGDWCPLGIMSLEAKTQSLVGVLWKQALAKNITDQLLKKRYRVWTLAK